MIDMRTKKQIRKSRKTRFVLGIIMMIIALALMIFGYVAIEKELFFIGDLKYNGASYAILATVTAIWFVAATMLAVGGVIIIINRKQVYFEYSDRPYSSKL